MYGLVLALIVLVAICALVVYQFRKPRENVEPVIGQAAVLEDTTLRRNATLGAPPIKDLHASDKVSILSCVTDSVGNRWFRVSSESLDGYVRAQEVVPRQVTDRENGFVILRHSLLSLDDPAALPEVTKTVEEYFRTFPDSIHRDELMWFLAERSQKLAKVSSRPQAALALAREYYSKLAQGNSEFAYRARQELGGVQAARVGTPRASPPPGPSPMRLTIVGGERVSVGPDPGQSPSGAIRMLTVVSRTPLAIRLSDTVQASPGAVFRGRVEGNVLVNSEVAVPQGSLSHLTFVGQSAPSEGGIQPSDLRLSDIVIENRTFRVSAVALRIDLPSGSKPPEGKNSTSQIPTGTRIVFSLTEPLVVPHT